MTNTDGPDELGGTIPDLEQLRAAADARVRQQIADATQRRDQAAQTRSAFAERRQHGIHHRHAAKQARTRLTAAHNTPDGDDAA